LKCILPQTNRTSGGLCFLTSFSLVALLFIIVRASILRTYLSRTDTRSSYVSNWSVTERVIADGDLNSGIGASENGLEDSQETAFSREYSLGLKQTSIPVPTSVLLSFVSSS